MAGKPFIVLSLPDALNDYQKMCDGDARTAAKGLGLAIEVVYAEDQLAKQIEQLSGYIRRNKASQPFALLVLPIHDRTLERVARDAARQGIGGVCLNRGVDSIGDLRKDFS